MEPVAIAISTVVFGVVTSLSVFIRHLLVSRDKHLNDEAQLRALDQETQELEKLRKQMESSQRFDSHYKVLDSNKDDIQYLDEKIEDILSKKFALIQRYSDMAVQESQALTEGAKLSERKEILDLLKQEIDSEIKFYDQQLEQFQSRRSSFWDTHHDLQDYLLQQEKERNGKLDELYQRHTNLLEKIYVRHNENSEHVALKSIDSGIEAFKFITAPLQMILQFFHLTSNINPNRFAAEHSSRMDVQAFENDINGPDIDTHNDSYYDETKSMGYTQEPCFAEP